MKKCVYKKRFQEQQRLISSSSFLFFFVFFFFVVGSSSRLRRRQELLKADVVIVCYKCGDRDSLARVGTYWLPELRHMQVDKPVLLVGCKEDLVDNNNTTNSNVIAGDSNSSSNSKTLTTKKEGLENQKNREDEDMTLVMEQQLALLIDQWKEVEVCLQCSARKLSNVIEVFSHAQKAVMHPTGPLYDAATGQLKPACVRALKRIFQLCDIDQDGCLSNKELNHFQTTCFNTPLQPEELEGVRKVVQTKIPDGIHANGITLKGFVYLHALFVARGRMDTTWTVLRKFGYDNSLHLREDLVSGILNPLQHSPDQIVELSERGTDFFKQVFKAFDKDEDGVLSSQELEDVFSTSPSSPQNWQRTNFSSVVETSSSTTTSSSSSRSANKTGGGGGLTLNGFLSMWDLTTMQAPKVTLTYMLYLGFKLEDLQSAIHISRRRKLDVKRGSLTRNVLNCFVFATKQSSTQTVLKALIGNSKSVGEEASTSVTSSRIEVDGVEKTLVMHQHVIVDVDNLSAKSEVMAACDLALFAYNGNSSSSFGEALAILKQVEQSGSGYLPCVMVATSDKVDEGVMGYSLNVCQSLKMVKPFHISSDLSALAGAGGSKEESSVFSQLAKVALTPSLSIPQTEERIAQQQYQLMLRRITAGLVIGTGVFSVGLIAMKLMYSSGSDDGTGSTATEDTPAADTA